ncbi:hypothetical protein [Nocardioides bruguierae]|uniref:Uncharacterized protein n=1 Tax=Nocardioides bruguierae TaxID=2945102 RepID=A0A9X2IF48_9ACTN|nr:hypothetical protein [Nocardioides bruguierae]MCL8027453.1 hypothetical protein [Nocardioides bruguierae]MCM0620723.1 hypothetical protein [Nocardioides bruguierae]
MATTAPAGTARPVRRGAHPGRRLLMGASLLVMFGSFLPWIDTPVGLVTGMQGAGLWTFYAAALGIAGVLVPFRSLAIAQAAALGVAAVGLGTWQLLHLYLLVGLGGWTPGPGIVMVIGGGVAALGAAWKLWRLVPAA